MSFLRRITFNFRAKFYIISGSKWLCHVQKQKAVNTERQKLSFDLIKRNRRSEMRLAHSVLCDFCLSGASKFFGLNF
jgi:hypothetical protein